MDGVGFIGSYGKAIEKLDQASYLTKLGNLKAMAIDQTNSPYRRFGSARVINDIRLKHKAAADAVYTATTAMIQEIKQKETNAELKGIFETMMGN